MLRSAHDKRQRLVTAAADLFHRRGLASTSLAEVAHLAAIPPGNVYYHFRSKNDLVFAVATYWADRTDSFLLGLEDDTDPWARLAGFVARAHHRRANYAEVGCPIAALNRDLRQGGNEHEAAAAASFQRQLAWLAEQFVAGGIERGAAVAHARLMLASIQGSFLLSHSLADDGPITDVAAQLDHWLKEVRANASRA